ncbi:MAG TPA: GxxExxY protein [Sphingomicrobium sp.]|nr:GxxExxY protein [Sphingomicrobium sp.]
MPEIEEIASAAVNCGFHIHKELGPGLLESAYEALLTEALTQEGLAVVRQQPVSVTFRGIALPDAFRADIVVENSLVIEVKSVERNAPVHAKQLLTYLRLMKQPLGLLMNFGCETFRDGVKRVVNNYNSFAP